MNNKKISCDGCSRGCIVEISYSGGKYYIAGNNCERGEQTARKELPFLKNSELQPKPKEENKSFFKKLFGK